ncbi:hypothetical protein PHYBLDRAFT_138653 [Phycomyces blakesleeanus NRRL 1555(-)]|uniref:SWIM-type domain-containing protein n=1 Tax=Phycomyces blakesleeanus (strain ATCC 8743b / DSM 1359 / FGSC 10004 / NBRC 33097 / NRRL 1555) TaxID=763407 RepID=A0A162Q8Y9_PHYB8|nr:hypothetical protein PHYBLDRAFT_138653 [Phycomyces blakesleeanus NRRL 1555(-)]OAD81106.1 hypothetical protein PHYBLDRAFT_138653 [Phycomyces blakesleeanus NRRL 1555(-)]|eukprot:XP_018299146.1 hypothetical protein PHYBLDRAFT_138653 [Phycomyces blakesleeanus NRRL 1555(-)]
MSLKPLHEGVKELHLPEDDEKCYCMNKVQYGLPCHHILPVERDLQISDLPDRWVIDARKEDKAWNQPNMQVPVIEKPKEWMIILLSNCKHQRTSSIQEDAKAAAVLNTCQRTLVTQCEERQVSWLELPGLRQFNATKNKTKQIEKEPLDPVDATKNKTKQSMPPKKNGFKRPATALEDYQYDNRTSVGKRIKFQSSFPVSHEIIDDVKGGFSPTADGWCDFWVLAHLIYKDQNKFPLVKRDMLAALPKYKPFNISNTNTNTNTNTNFIPVCSDDICVYSDSPNTSSTTFLPFALPNNNTKQQQPLIFNHVNSNHWTTVDLSRNISRKWPTVPKLFSLGCARNKIDDNFDTYWNKLKEFNKNDRRNAMLSLYSQRDEPIDLTPK